MLLALVWLAPEGWKLVRPLNGAGAVGGKPTLTVLSVNALYGRSNATLIELQAEMCKADVVVFQEYTPKLAAELKLGMKSFPHRVEMSRDDAFGQGVFSRTPFAKPPEIYPSSPRWSVDPQISVWVEFDGGLVRVTDVHLLPPVGLSALAEQRRQVSGLAADVRSSLAAESGASVRVERIVAGDFNGTPDGHIVGALNTTMADSWADSSHGRGGTWPTDSPLSKLGKIRLDNLLHTDGLACVASGVGIETGSDHLPTWARYVRAPAREPTASVGSREKGAK
ncbi:MAG: endonuclease/exonuclease/phosphatase family protein [Phycisphaerales bacterium]